MTVAEERAPVEFELSARYRAGAGPVLLTGVQAIARMLVEQHAADARAGLSTASFVSGYQGSPLGGLDQTLARATELQENAGLTLVPAVNEELAATAIWGSQVEVPGHGRSVDGVVGVWYGKAPGVDRAGDPLRHGNMCGAHPSGGVLVLAGDDPSCKSSTIPCISERTLMGYGLPVLYPGTAEEIVRLGRYGIALSRASGMWVGMKITSDVADGVYAFDGVSDLPITVPELDWEGTPWRYRQYPMLVPPGSLEAEAQMYGPRWAMVRAFLAANPINTVEVDAPGAWLGIVAGGKAFTDVRQALRDLGLDDDALARAGVKLLRLGMIHPIERDKLREFATGVDTVLVVEEKSAFVESAVRDALYGLPDAPAVIGSADAAGAPLVPVAGELTAGALTGPLRRVLGDRVELAPPRREPAALPLLAVGRTPYFCSGCPHNRSTLVPEGAVAGGGIGCHAMVAFTGRPESEVSSITQMGGEGAQWIGQAPYTDAGHMFQNMGDGTFAHSGQLAVQACVAAGVSITYKLLFNRAVAMTGGQDAAGGLEVPALTAKLLAEGVAKIIVCADEPERFRDLAPLPSGVALWPRDRLDDAQRVLAETPGVTVLIYDQRCAAESRRLRKRGAIPVRTTRVVINEAVCEGCGDCGVKSNCLSVQPVETELGRKTRIDQTSCNTDYSCLAGDCPSFVTVEAGSGSTARPESAGAAARAGRRAARPAATCSWRASAAPASSRSTRCSARRRSATGSRCTASTRPGCRRRPGRSPRTCASPATPPSSGPPTGSARRAATWRSTCSSGPTRATSATPPRRRRPPSCPPARCRPGPWCATPAWPPRTCPRWSSGSPAAAGPSSRSTRRPRPTPCSATPCPPTCCSSARPTSRARCPSRPRRSSGRSS